jgi:hypothetical protein
MRIFIFVEDFIGTVGSVSFIVIKRQIGKAVFHFGVIRDRGIGCGR